MKKILLIEDEKNIASSLKIYLSSKGFEVILADDGPGCIKMAKEQVPDLILLDLILPKIDGYTVCKTLKEEKVTKEIPIVVISARTSQKDMNKCFTTGADDYIAKPFKTDQIIDLISKYLKK